MRRIKAIGSLNPGHIKIPRRLDDKSKVVVSTILLLIFDQIVPSLQVNQIYRIVIQDWPIRTIPQLVLHIQILLERRLPLAKTRLHLLNDVLNHEALDEHANKEVQERQENDDEPPVIDRRNFEFQDAFHPSRWVQSDVGTQQNEGQNGQKEDGVGVDGFSVRLATREDDAHDNVLEDGDTEDGIVFVAAVAGRAFHDEGCEPRKLLNEDKS